MVELSEFLLIVTVLGGVLLWYRWVKRRDAKKESDLFNVRIQAITKTKTKKYQLKTRSLERSYQRRSREAATSLYERTSEQTSYGPPPANDTKRYRHIAQPRYKLKQAHKAPAVKGR